MTDSKTPYLDVVSASLPSTLSDLLLSFDFYSREKLDTLVRFCMGGSCPPRMEGHAGAWSSAQDRLRTRFQQLEPQTLGKRVRDENSNGIDYEGVSASSKKQKFAEVDDSEEDLYTLHSISVTSPIRKKVNITITPSTIRLTNAASHVVESRIELANIRRAFILSNLGKNKNKPRWSVVLISSDTSDKKDASSQLQLTFAVDHAPSNAKDLFTTTSQSGEVTAHPKGTETLSYLQSFLTHLPPHIRLVTSPDLNLEVQPFLSSSAQPYVEAYRHAKEGALYFLDSGILWAESKPAEFFALEDLEPDSDEPGIGGVKTLSATGRTFSLFVRRRAERPKNEDGDEVDAGDEEEIPGEETEFAMIDGREQENVLQWVRRYRKFFGRPREVSALQVQQRSTNGDVKGKGKAKATPEEVAAMNAEDEGSEASDEDYVAPSDSDGGEPSSESDSEDESGDRESEDEAEESGEEGEGAEDEEGEGLDPARHPLLRPGAMPKMSQAAMDAAVRMVTGDVVGRDDEDEEEEDELE